MRCPYCNSTDSRVTDSRPDIEDAIIRRRRVCEQCGAKFTTVERIQMRDLMVRKNSGKLEAFDREKLRRSIKLACRNRDVGDEQIEKLEQENKELKEMLSKEPKAMRVLPGTTPLRS